MKREKAIAILKEIVANQVLSLYWVSLVNLESDEYELHLKSESCDPACLEPIVEKHNLVLKEANGVLVVHG